MMLGDLSDKTAQSVFFITRKWPPAVGGMETYSVELVNALKKHVNLTSNVLPGCKNGRPPSISSLFYFMLTSLLMVMFGRRHDVIHVGDLVLWPLALVARIFQPRSRIVITAYGLDIVYGYRNGVLPKIYNLYLKIGVFFLRHAIGIIAISRATASLCERIGFKDIVTVPLGVTLSKNPSSVTCRSGKKYLLFVGRLVKRKGAGWFISEVLPKLNKDLIVRIAGKPWDQSEWEIVSTNPRVEYLGVVPDEQLMQLRCCAQVVLMPNIHIDDYDIEGFGLTALEAASDGGVLLASGIEGITDAVVDGKTGFLLPDSDPDAWLEKINEVVSWNDEKRQAFIDNARALISEQFSWERVALDTIEAYGLRKKE